MPTIQSRPGPARPAVRRLLGALALAGGLVASPALAAGADDLCTFAGEPADLPAYPTDTALRDKATEIEAMLAANRPPADLKAALAVADVQPARPSPAALAAYCAAAGEAARTSREGGQFQAHAYLIAAFRQAESIGLADVSAQAAYRLGLVHAVETASAGGRGAAFAGGSGSDLSSGQGQACDAMRDPIRASCGGAICPNSRWNARRRGPAARANMRCRRCPACGSRGWR